MSATAALLCLALNLYHEARGEPIPGQQAVAHVTINRARATRQSICEVVYAPSQFSWTITEPKVRDERAWQQSLQVARKALSGRLRDNTGGATHYHATYVRPKWAAGMERTKRIGKHVFYVGDINKTMLAAASITKTPS